MSWITSKLGDIVTIISGTTPKSDNQSFWNGHHVWVTPTDLGKNNTYIIASSERKITDAGVNSCNLTLIPQGSVVMSSRAPIGHLAIAGCDLYTNQGCKSFVCSDAINNEFLFFMLKSLIPKLQESGSGSTFLEVSKTVLENFEIIHPVGLKEQCQIAARLKAQLAEVDKARQAAEVQLRDGLVLHSRLLKGIFAELDSAPKKVLGDHAVCTSGSTPARGNKQYWQPAEIPWVKTAEVAFNFITTTEEAISRTALDECSVKLLPPDTVLIAMYGQGKTRGQSAILKIPATTNQACFAILPNDTWEPEFLFLWLKSSYQDLRTLSEDRGGNQANLNGRMLKALEIPAPDKSMQREIVQRIKIASAQMGAIEKASKMMMSEIKQLPNKLLAQAFEQ
jgi:type I restriction enzyme S subunit